MSIPIAVTRVTYDPEGWIADGWFLRYRDRLGYPLPDGVWAWFKYYVGSTDYSVRLSTTDGLYIEMRRIQWEMFCRMVWAQVQQMGTQHIVHPILDAPCQPIGCDNGYHLKGCELEGKGV